MGAEPVDLFQFLRGVAFAAGRGKLTRMRAAVAVLAALDSDGTSGTGVVVRTDQIALELGISTSQVWRHFGALTSAGWFEQTEKPARGGIGLPGRKARYRCTLPPLDLGMAALPEPERVASPRGDTRDVSSERVASPRGDTRDVSSERVASPRGDTRDVSSERVAVSDETCRSFEPNVSHRQAGICDSPTSNGPTSDGPTNISMAGLLPKAEDTRAGEVIDSAKTRAELIADARRRLRAGHRPVADPGDIPDSAWRDSDPALSLAEIEEMLGGHVLEVAETETP